MAKLELDRAATTSSSEDVRSRLSTLSLGVNSTQPAERLLPLIQEMFQAKYKISKKKSDEDEL